jgi:thioesterase domain-containing protein
MPPGSGCAFSYEPLPKFANDLAVYSLGSPFLMTESEASWTVEEAAAIYVRTIRNLQPQGPRILGGWSMGAITAYEIAYQLHQQGERDLGVINLDMPLPRSDPNTPEPTVKLLEILGFYPPVVVRESPTWKSQRTADKTVSRLSGRKWNTRLAQFASRRIQAQYRYL